MEETLLDDKHFPLSPGVFSSQDVARLFREHRLAILIILEYLKARDWPWKGSTLSKSETTIPLVWAIFDAASDHNIKMAWDIHPMKCLPSRYNHENPNSNTSALPVVKSGAATLGGCSRNFVTISNRRYEVAEKNHQYCSAFGLPDDCFAPGFETRMMETLKQYENRDIWCFGKTPYTQDLIEPNVKLLYMKGEFLPCTNFIYVDTSERFLTALFKSKELQSINAELWYSFGRELIDEMNLDDDGCFRFEEKAVYFVRKRLIHEFVRQSLLLTKRDSFLSFQPAIKFAPPADVNADVACHLQEIIDQVNSDAELHASSSLAKIRSQLDFGRLKSHRFMVMDVEYIHVPYPTPGRDGFFNFPCIFSNLVWNGARGLEIRTNVFLIPCHYCTQRCQAFKQNKFDFGCLSYGFDLIESQNDLIEQMLSAHEGFRMYTYGRSDAFQLEQGSTFFSDSFEWRRYERRNRKIARRITEISEDLAEPHVGLDILENGILKTWLGSPVRRWEKVNVNSRFMTQHGTPNWERNYFEAIASCASDTTSAFFYLLYKKYGQAPAAQPHSVVKK